MLKAIKNGRFLEMMAAQNIRHFLLNNSCNQKKGSTIPSENAFLFRKSVDCLPIILFLKISYVKTYAICG